MAFPTRFTVPGLPDGQCWARPCMQPGENKGTFVKGRGYTAYLKEPKPICARNCYQGCPYPLPEPNPEVARCCYRPDYRRKGFAPAKYQECETCGTHVPLRAAKVLNKLPTQTGVRCWHPDQEALPIMLVGWFHCGACDGFWDHRPKALEALQYTFEDHLAELKRRVAKAAEGDP